MSEATPARPLWNKSGSPTRYVAAHFGVEHFRIREIIHDLKASANLDPDDDVVIYPDGRVTDVNGEEIGNIVHEF